MTRSRKRFGRLILGLLFDVRRRLGKLETMTMDIKQEVQDLSEQVSLQSQEIDVLLANDQQLRQQTADALAAAKGAPSAETIQVLEAALAAMHANTDKIKAALQSGSASGQVVT